VTFALLALASTTAASFVTYVLARSYMIQQRERSATRQAFVNARLAKSLLNSEPKAPEQVVGAVTGEAGTQVLLRFEGRWYTSAVSLDPDQLPASLTEAVNDGSAARQRFNSAGSPILAVGVPIDGSAALYYEVSTLRVLQRTLSILATSLVVASALTTLTAAAAGFAVSRRLLRPLRRISDAAVDIADGDLERRLDAEGDDDLEPLVDSFNHMVDSMNLRVEREARFASDVSHELRTPLTALSTAVEIVRARSADMPPRAGTAVQVLASQVGYFERLVLDLLEISRLDAGSEGVQLDDIDLLDFLDRLSRELDGPPVDVESPGPWNLGIDSRRVERIVTNLYENAERYAGGVTRLGLARHDGVVCVSVEDAGPGIPAEDRDRVFERFWRGAVARQQTSRGSGLGLSLVAEHVRLLGGTIRVSAAESCGARFVVELPAKEWTP
jgi:signal transduction histidine kinase